MFPFESIAYAQDAAGAGVTGNPLFQMVPFVLIFVVFFFLIIRPQQKKQKAHQEMLNQIKKEDKVVTASGIYGTVKKINEQTMHLQIADKVVIQIERSQVARMANENSAKSEGDSKDDDGKKDKSSKAEAASES